MNNGAALVGTSGPATFNVVVSLGVPVMLNFAVPVDIMDCPLIPVSCCLSYQKPLFLS